MGQKDLVQNIPYYKNRPDNSSCMLACIKGALEYLSTKKYSWEDIEKLLGYKPKRAAWTVKAWTELAQQGYDIEMHEPFDYPKYAREGKKYLESHLTPEQLKWQLENSNLLDIRSLIPEFLKTVKHVKESPTIATIDSLLKREYLVFVTLNSRILNGKPGYTAHMILVFDKDGDTYVAHDPGLTNAQAGRRISETKLYEAMEGDGNINEVTGIKLK